MTRIDPLVKLAIAAAMSLYLATCTQQSSAGGRDIRNLGTINLENQWFMKKVVAYDSVTELRRACFKSGLPNIKCAEASSFYQRDSQHYEGVGVVHRCIVSIVRPGRKPQKEVRLQRMAGHEDWHCVWGEYHE